MSFYTVVFLFFFSGRNDKLDDWSDEKSSGTIIVIKTYSWSSHCGSVEMNPTNIYEDMGSIPGSLSGSGSGVAVSCGVGRRRGSDPTLLWL